MKAAPLSRPAAVARKNFQLSEGAARLKFRRRAEAVESQNFGRVALRAVGVFMSIFSSARRRAFALLALAALLSNALAAASAQVSSQQGKQPPARRMSDEQRAVHVLNRLPLGAPPRHGD